MNNTDNRMPMIASPATRPLATSIPFSFTALCRASSTGETDRSTSHFNRPPMKIAADVSKGRYIPTAISIGARAPQSSSATPNAPPIASSPQAICPPTIPFASCAISPACGAGNARPPMPPVSRFASCSAMIGAIRKKASSTTVTISTTCIFHGVPPSRCPAFRSWISDPETLHAHATTAATPSTAATPGAPVTPMAVNSSADSTNADSVSPDSGWFEHPTNPHK